MAPTRLASFLWDGIPLSIKNKEIYEQLNAQYIALLHLLHGFTTYASSYSSAVHSRTLTPKKCWQVIYY